MAPDYDPAASYDHYDIELEHGNLWAFAWLCIACVAVLVYCGWPWATLLPLCGAVAAWSLAKD